MTVGSSHGIDAVPDSPPVLKFILPPNIDDLPAYQAMAAAAIRNTDTRVYVDTSWLMWLLHIGRSARREFLEFWSSGNATSKVYVPVWAVHELYYHLQKGRAYRR